MKDTLVFHEKVLLYIYLRFTEMDFDDIIEHLKRKNSDKYKFLLKAGESFQNVIFKLFKLIWENETKPDQFKNTKLYNCTKEREMQQI